MVVMLSRVLKTGVMAVSGYILDMDKSDTA